MLNKDDKITVLYYVACWKASVELESHSYALEEERQRIEIQVKNRSDVKWE